jgi:EAL domain-containing protein (putative c-di-GMP-specific phosphodiesterase class I)
MANESDLRHAFSRLLYISNNVYFANICHFAVTTALQPVYTSNQKLIGYEALLRPYFNNELVSVQEFLDKMRASQDIAFTDKLLRALHLRNFSLLNHQSELLFLNYEYESITDLKDIEVYKNLLIKRKQEIGIENTQIVIEVLEHDVGSEKNLKIMSNWHRQHHSVLVAMDDMTDTESDWLRLNNIQPEIVKIDISMLQSTDYLNFVSRLQQYPIKILQEGIETAEQKALALSAGVHYLQGYYLGYPTLIEQLDCKEVSLLCRD